MKNIKIMMLIFLLSFVSNSIFAHALWIETKSTGNVGQKQVVKVFYGEFVSNERDSVDKWYSDVNEFSLWLVGPDQKKTQIAVVPGVNFFEGAFTPVQSGAYTVMVSHEAKELGGLTKYHFLSSANIVVGKVLPTATQNTNVLKLHVDAVLTAKVNKMVQVKSFLNDQVAKGKTVAVFTPSGWSKELKTNDYGVVEFEPLWAGRYVIEISDMDKTAGKHHGKDFNATWRGATYSFEVK
ncbi:hypothetical protein ADIARSV_3295 [Arcticibacter svalbardensis MN12-7]|uniref:DUF4198 domain-containing protein n=1 Tax=Arcticibacter svalbardensis MN12-7 TaxID=1150600 RepID=R9GP24_9SPHI|nr:hypothetical protein [Arcticibacter svalbardensis]EOR93582.1 hypothetical protein ADIARSV_3295 [Arcticibacter svalbardensis MN12-7]